MDGMRKLAQSGRRIGVVLSVLIIISLLAASIDVVGLAQAARAVLDPAPPPEQKADEALTDVAPPPPAVDVRADEHPALRLGTLGLDRLPLAPPGSDKLPPDWTQEQVANPPRWTNALTAPDDAPPSPPNPFQDPPMAVNPERGKSPTDPGPPWMEPPAKGVEPPGKGN